MGLDESWDRKQKVRIDSKEALKKLLSRIKYQTRPSSIKITEFDSGLLLDTGCVIMLKSSSIRNGLLHRLRGVVRGVVTGVE